LEGRRELGRTRREEGGIWDMGICCGRQNTRQGRGKNKEEREKQMLTKKKRKEKSEKKFEFT
jgi:hypothetical protein